MGFCYRKESVWILTEKSDGVMFQFSSLVSFIYLFIFYFNWKPRGKLGAFRRLRLGDLISPFHFTLVVNVMRRLMNAPRIALRDRRFC